MPELTKDALQDLGVTVVGDALAIIRQCKQVTVTALSSTDLNIRVKAPSAKLPQLKSDMTMSVLQVQNRLGCIQTRYKHIWDTNPCTTL